ncbi:MAG TPA: GH3 auxin-responsive promoter family protein, partial [Chryseosolibacter sp.]|nr:GH3 auxin-responsive promoter family protein [Chryseosolibacter sp.]
MGIRSVLARPVAAYIAAQTQKWSSQPGKYQERIFRHLVAKGRSTIFGKDHGFESIKHYEDFKKQVPVRDYEQLRPYIEQVLAGKPDVLWPGKPAYFAKTSGTTSGVKYIPITKDSVSYHFGSARNATLSYVHETGKSAFLDGGLIFLSGSPELEEISGIKTGRLSGISNHLIPSFLRTN